VMIAPRFVTGAAEMDDGKAAIIIQPEEILREAGGGYEAGIDANDDVLSQASTSAEEWRRERLLRVVVFSRGDNLYGVPLGFLSEVIPARRLTRIPALGRAWQGLFFARGMCHGLIGIPGSCVPFNETIHRMLLLKSPERCGIGATQVLGHFVLPHQKLQPDRLQNESSDIATFGVFQWKGTGVRVIDIPGTLRRACPHSDNGIETPLRAAAGTEPLMQTRIVDDR
jgi:hypothetical protein